MEHVGNDLLNQLDKKIDQLIVQLVKGSHDEHYTTDSVSEKSSASERIDDEAHVVPVHV
jgi:hypothetical protein